jgi:hypothetical protein
MDCTTTEAAIAIMIETGINESVWESIGERIGFHMRERTKGRAAVDFVVFTQEHGVLIRGST